jgi:CrcB protein
LVEDDLSLVPADRIDPDAPVGGRRRDRQWDVTVAVLLGGIAGAEARYGLAAVVPHAASGFPWSTVYINVVGCVCLGILMVLLGQLSSPHRLLRPFIGIGMCGGFTTFSTFTVDAERLIQAHRAGLAGLYVLCTLVAAAAATAAATIATQLVGRYVHARRRRRADADRNRNRAAVDELSGGRP